ncbi:hypothetical protein J1N35_023037 [Gossypium stocksii]|uniref:Pentatricopeptide repeat-containing protein n=1 Tax=Gossypium stocksii TaxID=47602 RepID=A0A9D3VI26_9ROSI|nr:hypothetical protein J1N35_023037 [Gossypium stocksii]
MLCQFGKYPLETTQSQVPIFETGWNNKENDSCNQTFEVSLPVSVDVETAMRCTVSSELVVEVFSWVLKNWEVLFTLFLLAGKQPDYAQSLREHHSMISIIGKMRKLDTASALVDEMRERRFEYHIEVLNRYRDMTGSPHEAEMVGKEMSKRVV